MKNISLALGLIVLASAMSPGALVAAEKDQTGSALGRALQGKPLESGPSAILRPVKNNPCVELGAGFVNAGGTCVRVGGYVRAGVGAQR